MLAYLTAFLWRVGLLGIVLAETSCVVSKVRRGLAASMLRGTCALAFGTTVLLTLCYAGSFCGHIAAPRWTVQIEEVLTPGLCVLATVGFLAATLACFAGRKPADRPAVRAVSASTPACRPNATWEEIKAAWTLAYAGDAAKESPHQNALRRWAGTLALCAGVCLLATCVEVAWSDAQRPNATPGVERRWPSSTGAAATHRASPSENSRIPQT